MYTSQNAGFQMLNLDFPVDFPLTLKEVLEPFQVGCAGLHRQNVNLMMFYGAHSAYLGWQGRWLDLGRDEIDAGENEMAI